MKLVDIVQANLDNFNQWLWRTKPNKSGFLMRVLRLVLQIFVAITRDLRDGQLSMRAMSLVYTTVIAVVPLIALSFSVLKGFGMHHQVEPALLDAMIDLGDKRFDIVSNVMSFIDNINVGVLGSVGFAILIYSVIAMMHKIEHAFNYTWQLRRDRNMSQRFRDYLSVIFVGPLLIFLSAAITTSFNSNIAIEYFIGIPYGSQLIHLLGGFLPYVLMSLGFALIYMFLPNTQVRVVSAIVGGLVTAVFWKIMGWGVSTFIANSASNVAIYSAFASVIILMVWMYLGWLVLLVGASIAFYHQNPQYLKYRRDNQIISAEIKEKLALNILYLIGQHYDSGDEAWTVSKLAHKLSIAEYVVDDIVDELSKLEYVVCSSEEGDSLYPKKPLRAILLNDVIRDIRFSRAEKNKIMSVHFDEKIKAYFSDKQTDLPSTLDTASIEDLINQGRF